MPDAIRNAVADGTIPGAVTLISSADRVLSCEALGVADIETARPMTPDTLFWIASTSKPITAAAFMMLVDERKATLDDPVEKHLPEFRGQMVAVEQDDDHAVLKKPCRPMTLRDALSHVSGLPFLSRVEQVIDGRPLREAAVSYAMTNLKSEPGAVYSYSNCGTNTIGRVIEVLAKMPYEQFIRERIFAPLGMMETTFFPTAEQIARLATSYEPHSDGHSLRAIRVGQLTYPLDRPDRHVSPAGGLFSVASEVAAFGRALLTGKYPDGRQFLSIESLRAMTTTQNPHLLKDGQTDGYGLCLATSRLPDPAAPVPAGIFGHGGAYNNDFAIDAERGIVAVIMVQLKDLGDRVGPIFRAFKTQAAEQYGS
jgi:CubicO group peptidase (beta-lactamase class C family)